MKRSEVVPKLSQEGPLANKNIYESKQSIIKLILSNARAKEKWIFTSTKNLNKEALLTFIFLSGGKRHKDSIFFSFLSQQQTKYWKSLCFCILTLFVCSLMYSYRSRKECLLAFPEKVFEFMFTENLRQSIERRCFLIENCLPSKNSLEPCKYLCQMTTKLGTSFIGAILRQKLLFFSSHP